MNIKVNGSSTENNYITNLETRGLKYIVDEPIEKGGQNTAVTPMELLAGALSSCTIITLQMYFNHKEWSYNDIKVDVEFDSSRIPYVFNRKIKISGSFDDKQKLRLEKIANACPVHKAMEVGHTVLTSFVF